jgi:hypothetical protein
MYNKNIVVETPAKIQVVGPFYVGALARATIA